MGFSGQAESLFHYTTVGDAPIRPLDSLVHAVMEPEWWVGAVGNPIVVVCGVA